MPARTECYVTAWGLFFCLGHGWVKDPLAVGPVCDAVAAIVKLVQPGVVVVEVSA